MSDSTAPPRTEPSATRTVLLRGGEVHSPADPFATAMVVERGQVAWVGSRAPPTPSPTAWTRSCTWTAPW